MKNLIGRWFSKGSKDKVASGEKASYKSAVFVNRAKEGSSDLYRLTLDSIPHGKVEKVLDTPAVLIHAKKYDKSPVYSLFTDREFFIGRNSKNDLCLQGKEIVDVHAKIRPEKEGYILYDLISKSGVYVNWEKVLRHKLEHRDKIRLGNQSLIFELLKDKDEEIFDGVERRKTARITPAMTLKFLVYSKDKLEEFSGIVKDISIDGIRIETERELSKGSIIDAGISCDKFPLLEVIAQVIWTQSKQSDSKVFYQVGLQFIEMDNNSRNILRDYLVKCVS